MSLFDDIVVNAKSAANTVGKKAGQLKDYSKLKYSESGIKSEIAKKKQALGDYVYECTKTGDINQEKMQFMVDEIEELEENLQITREMLVTARNKITCSNCKSENDKESLFCCKCGQKLSEDAQKECSCDCDVTVAVSSKADDITSEPIEVEELEDITVAEKATDVATEESAVENKAETEVETDILTDATSEEN